MSICASACSKSTFFSGGGSFTRGSGSYSDYSSIHSSDCLDYSNYLSIPDLHSDSDYGIHYDMHCPYTALVVVDSADSHIRSALLSSALTDTP